MRALSRATCLAGPRSKPIWLALATGSLAGLAVLGACSNDASKVTGTRPLPNAPASMHGVVGGNHHKIVVCVDPTSDAGPGGGSFDFTIAANTSPGGSPAWFEYPAFPADPDFVTMGFLAAQNSFGPFPVGGGSDVITTSPSIAVGNCTDVFVRTNTCPNADCGPDPFDNAGNRLWTLLYGQGVVNPFGAVDITATIPTGYTFTLNCVNDDPDLPQSCTNGGYTAANVFHGSSFTFKFTAPPETPCPAGLFSWEIADQANETGFPSGGVGDLLIKYDQFPAPNDNSYGDNAVGWPGGHTFGNLTGSDKAGVQIKNGSGTVVLSFNMDYLSAVGTAPSGYASLGVTGGDGGMVVGTATGISVTTSLANNLNNINIPGLFNPGTHTQLIGSVDVLQDSPPTDPAHLTYNITDPALAGWDFHNTYYARISVAKLTTMGFDPNTWSVQPNLTVLHNSPDKPCPPGPFPCSDITVGAKTFGSKEVKADVNNVNLTTDAFVTGVHITWPVGTNGALKQIKVGGDVIWTGTNTSGSVDLLLADLVADANKRKIAKKSDEDIKFVFANNVSETLANYTASLDFGDNCNVPILP